MSDDWQVPDDLADRIRLDRTDAWAREIERTAEVRAILTDLIAELRAAHRPAADLDGEPRLCTEGCGITPCPTLRYADRAEQRLQHTEQ